MSLTKELNKAIDELKETDIYGCITGSCLLEEDFDTWESIPDIDIFVYSRTAMMHAIMVIENLGYEPGGKGKPVAGEKIKKRWLIEDINNHNGFLNTIMYHRNDILVNITYKNGCTDVTDVLSTFDMSIIMKGYDISKGLYCDMRTLCSTDTKVAMPNYLNRNINDHPSRFNLNRLLRQWDRVIKYYNRGFDTRPMAKYYLDCINVVIDTGAAFETENDKISFTDMEPRFLDYKAKISAWIKEHEED